MLDSIQEVLVSQEALAQRVRELGERITLDYQGRDLLVVGVLRGVALFMGDLIREIQLPLDIDYMAISSYGSSTSSSGVVRILKDLDETITGRHVLIVEDIIDTGLTLSYLTRALEERKPASLAICSLLDKPSRRVAPVDVQYVGFTVEDRFVVGYGLDYAQRFRNLPFIGILKPEVYSR
ncbi:MAG: hypoxanthine phosphoribosyltransferase [Candidatus Sericytochromatia bacterium]|nr:hypoxanthine phosphoribosyltransferase [Candidatus Sericytochromatia bacterium]